jgi:Ca2+-binding EF-hand superfamily protein
MQRAEKRLGFQNQSSEAVDWAFRKAVNGGTISNTAWAWLLRTCGLPEHPVYEKFRTDETHYNVYQLFVLGIMQSAGSKEQKLDLVFDFWDRERAGTLEKAQLTEITRAMAETCSNHISLIIPDSMLSSDRKKTYQSDLDKRRS